MCGATLWVRVAGPPSSAICTAHSRHQSHRNQHESIRFSFPTLDVLLSNNVSLSHTHTHTAVPGLPAVSGVVLA